MSLKATQARVAAAIVEELEIERLKAANRPLVATPHHGAAAMPSHARAGAVASHAHGACAVTSLNEMIASRMRWTQRNGTFDVIQAHQLGEEQVVVFVIVDKRAVLIYDDAGLFPSDTLITQLRLLENN